MVVTIEDRAVKFVPIELETTLQLEPCCITCKSTNKPLKSCSSCKLVSYCSRECQASDWERHKVEDDCKAVKKARLRFKDADEIIHENSEMVIEAAMSTFNGDFEYAFLGRDLDDDERLGDSIVNFVAGHFYQLPFTEDYMNCMCKVYIKVCSAAKRYQTRALWEQALQMIVEMKRLTHVAFPDMVDYEIPQLLLKLHRNDDAAFYVLYWVGWRTRWPNILNDLNMIHARKGDWPFPCREDARLLDLVDVIHHSNIVDIPFPVSFVFVALAVKLRYICVYRTLSMCANAFRHCTAGQTLPTDIADKIVGFLVISNVKEQAFHHVFAKQWDDTNRLLNYIDAKYPFLLPGVLDASLLPPIQQDEEGVVTDQDQSFHVRNFFEMYEGSPPVLKMLTEILKLRYGYSESTSENDYWENFKSNLARAPTS